MYRGANIPARRRRLRIIAREYRSYENKGIVYVSQWRNHDLREPFENIRALVLGLKNEVGRPPKGLRCGWEGSPQKAHDVEEVGGWKVTPLRLTTESGIWAVDSPTAQSQ